MEKNTGMDTVDAVTRMQAYIEAHITEPITQFQLARAAGYSEFYAARIFRALTGHSPFGYIRKLRLSRSALVLRDEQPKVVDVALDYVFDSHEGFTRAFVREFGVAPKLYSKNPRPLKLFMPSSIRSYYLLQRQLPIDMSSSEREAKNMNQKPSAIFVQVMERPARKLIVRRAKEAEDYFAYCEEVGCDVWGELCSIKGALYEPIGMWMPKSLRPQGTALYAQGVEVPADWQGILPEHMELVSLPSCKMLIFQGPPYEEDDMGEAIDTMWQLIETYDPGIYGYAWDSEAAPRFQLSPQGYRGYIEGRPVKPLNP